MKIKEIINYQWKRKPSKTLQEKAAKILVYFLVLMFLLTLLSRFADSLLIPRVKTDKAKAMTITHEIEVDGTIMQNREKGISVLENLKVSYINVYVGSSVNKNDVLFEVDLNDIKSKIEELNKEISEKEQSLARATEDYNLSVDKQDKVVAEALKQYNEAEKTVNQYNNASQEEQENLDREMIAAQYEQSKANYNQALSDKEENLIMAKRTLEDVTNSSNTEKLKDSLAKLQTIESIGGKILSTEEGIVTKINISVGDITTSNNIMFLADTQSGYKFKATLSKDLKKYAKQGQAVTLKVRENSKVVENLTIESISKGENELYDVNVTLPIEAGSIGDTATLSLSNKSKRYSVCVPLNALHQDGENKYYILVVGEKETILGTENVAQRVDISIEDKNDTYAALEDGTINNSQKIIVSSNKTIKEGDRVRMEEE